MKIAVGAFSFTVGDMNINSCQKSFLEKFHKYKQLFCFDEMDAESKLKIFIRGIVLFIRGFKTIINMFRKMIN